jgi:hypothetical protein
MKYDEKNMSDFFRFFINFINSYTQYVYDEAIYTGYVPQDYYTSWTGGRESIMHGFLWRLRTAAYHIRMKKKVEGQASSRAFGT